MVGGGRYVRLLGWLRWLEVRLGKDFIVMVEVSFVLVFFYFGFFYNLEFFREYDKVVCVCGLYRRLEFLGSIVFFFFFIGCRGRFGF